MQCKTCKAPLHYHTSGMTCRSCGYSVDHQFLFQYKCASCGQLLEESVSCTTVAVSLITLRSFNSLAVSLISFVVSLAAITPFYVWIYYADCPIYYCEVISFNEGVY